MFKTLDRELKVDGIIPTQLFPRKYAVQAANKLRLDSLATQLIVYPSRDSGAEGDIDPAVALKAVTAESSLELKVGAQVMLIKNMDSHLVNGSVGVAMGFHAASDVWGYGEISTKGGNGVIRNVVVDDEGPSQVIDLTGEVESGDGTDQPPCRGSTETFPLVGFVTQSGTEAVLMGREEFRIEDNDGHVIATRVQVRYASGCELWLLTPGSRSRWFLLGRCPYMRAKARRSSTSRWTSTGFSKRVRSSFLSHSGCAHGSRWQGQSYVALSRASSLDGLQVLHFDPKKVNP